MIVEKTETVVTYRGLAKKYFDPHVTASQWQDYKWQLNNSIRTIAAFEDVTGITFTELEKEAIEKTIRKFPLCITPYYASLIEQQNYRNDPVFKQAFPTLQN